MLKISVFNVYDYKVMRMKSTSYMEINRIHLWSTKTQQAKINLLPLQSVVNGSYVDEWSTIPVNRTPAIWPGNPARHTKNVIRIRRVKGNKMMRILRFFSSLGDHPGGSFLSICFYMKFWGETVFCYTWRFTEYLHVHSIWWKYPCESDPFDLNLIDE